MAMFNSYFDITRGYPLVIKPGWNTVQFDDSSIKPSNFIGDFASRLMTPEGSSALLKEGKLMAAWIVSELLACKASPQPHIPKPSTCLT